MGEIQGYYHHRRVVTLGDSAVIKRVPFPAQIVMYTGGVYTKLVHIKDGKYSDRH